MTPHTLIKNNQPVTPDFSFTSMKEFLHNRSATYGDKPALIFEDLDHKQTHQYSYQDLLTIAGQTAGFLEQAYGLQPGDHLAFSLPNTPEVVWLNLAAWSHGWVSVPLDTKRDTLDRKIYKLKLTGAKVLITDDSKEAKQENEEIHKALPKLNIMTSKGPAEFLKKIEKGSSSKEAAEHSLEEDSLILFTSGTTADPKGVRLTPYSLLANALSIQDWLQITEEDTFHVVLPLHHINSTTFVNTTLLAGGTVVLSPRYSKSHYWPTMATHRATASSIVPTIAYDLLTEMTRFEKLQDQLSQITRIQLGSAPVQPKVVKQFYHQYGIRLVQGYGQTETSLRSTGTPYSVPDSQYLDNVGSNTIGTELAYSNITVLKTDGTEAKEGEEGEICVRGPLIMKGYLKNEDATKEAFAHGWFHSGDTGYWQLIDGERYYYLKGRTKEIIKKGGILISPLAIENALLEEFPDIDQCFVVGFPHPRFGQDIGVVIVSSKHNDANYWQDCILANKSLSAYETPQSVVMVSPEDLPKTSTGKIQRIKLREQFEEHLRIQGLTITKTRSHTFRLLQDSDTQALKQAASISRSAWGNQLGADEHMLEQRAKLGYLIAAVDEDGNVAGTISALQIAASELTQAGESGHWTSNWEGVTSKGTLHTHNHKGDVLLCVDVNVKPHVIPEEKAAAHLHRESKKKPFDPEAFKAYLESGKDYVIRFHAKPKGGTDGATITTIIPKGRPEDQDALGYNILMTYPELTEEPTISPKASLGQQLVEAAMLFAYRRGIRQVSVYTRPAQASKHFEIS